MACNRQLGLRCIMKVLKSLGRKILYLLLIILVICIISGIQWLIRDLKTTDNRTVISMNKPVGVDTTNMTEDEINALMHGGE